LSSPLERNLINAEPLVISLTGKSKKNTQIALSITTRRSFFVKQKLLNERSYFRNDALTIAARAKILLKI
jgi:hypothetical protein